ncbi:putative EamA domain-containing protein [Helianthus annuus]|nr:putative EamA domain-containing protein [Helianthus annuus]
MMKMKSALPFAAMVVVQVLQVDLTLAGKKAIQTGMHNFSYIFYTNAIASLLLLPPAFFICRSPNRPTLTISVASGFLGLGILGFLMQVIGYVGITYASATEATAIFNLVPGFTFLFAIIFRVEKLGCGGLAKIIGTLISVIGAVTVTLYTGPTIITPRLSSIAPQHLLGQSSDFILGGLLMLIDSVLAALFLIAQALILKKYSAVVIVVLAYCSSITVFSLLASLILEHDINMFDLQSKTRLLAILYSGLFGSGFQIAIGAWCVKTKGPLFVAIFQPLGIVVAAILGVLFLGDGLYLGCLIGSAIIVVGFYGVMWGKSKEDKVVEAESSKSPLLQQDLNDVVP